MKKQTLQDVDDNLVNTGKFLQDFAKDSRKVACLEKFAECRGIVKWLRTETKGSQTQFIILTKSNIGLPGIQMSVIFNVL